MGPYAVWHGDLFLGEFAVPDYHEDEGFARHGNHVIPKGDLLVFVSMYRMEVYRITARSAYWSEEERLHATPVDTVWGNEVLPETLTEMTRWQIAAEATFAAAQERAWELFRSELTPAELNEWKSWRRVTFHGSSGQRYRLHEGRTSNIELIDFRGQRIRSYCVGPQGSLPMGDFLLGQYLGLKYAEEETLAKAP